MGRRLKVTCLCNFFGMTSNSRPGHYCFPPINHLKYYTHDSGRLLRLLVLVYNVPIQDAGALHLQFTLITGDRCSIQRQRSPEDTAACRDPACQQHSNAQPSKMHSRYLLLPSTHRPCNIQRRMERSQLNILATVRDHRQMVQAWWTYRVLARTRRPNPMH